MAKKITLKQIAKRKAKEEKQKIVTEYIIEIQKIVDQGYLDMTESLEEFNNELINSSMEYGNIQTQVQRLLKLEDLNEKTLDELMDKISIMETKNDMLYTTITSRSLNENKLLSHIPNMAEKVGNIINTASRKLQGNKNQAYIVSLLTNKSFDVFKSYNQYIIETALESNDYIDTYIDTRENFLDFIEECKNELEKRITYYHSESETEVIIEENIKYKQRLRVDYADLCSFLKYKGYECERQSSTTHAVWRHINSGHSLPLPNKSGTIPQGTTSKVLKQMGSSRNELAQFLYA